MAAALKRPKPYRARFVLVYVALVAAVGAAVAGLVLVLAPGGSSKKHVAGKEQPWSTWSPTAKAPEARASEIAEHVARAYRLPNGDQLLDVTARRPFINVPSGSTSKPVPIPISSVVVKGVNGKADEQTPLAPDDSELYNLCGLGNSCSIPVGKPSVARLRLIRRESLELALYTFKYLTEIKYVIAVLPPLKGTNSPAALYFHRSDFTRQLEVPLARTLSERRPVSSLSAREAGVVDRLTQSHMFTLRLVQTPQGDLILGLTPLR